MATISLATSGRLISSRTKFGGMAVPAAQLDLGRPFQEKLSRPFDERRQIFVCEDGALVPEQISFKFHFRELVVGVDGAAESLIAIQSRPKFDCRYPAKVVMLGRVLRPASAVRPTGELAAFLVFRIGRHRQSSWSQPVRARGSASMSAHHASPVDSCKCDHARRPAASCAWTMAVINLATSGRDTSSRAKFEAIQSTHSCSLPRQCRNFVLEVDPSR